MVSRNHGRCRICARAFAIRVTVAGVGKMDKVAEVLARLGEPIAPRPWEAKSSSR